MSEEASTDLVEPVEEEVDDGVEEEVEAEAGEGALTALRAERAARREAERRARELADQAAERERADLLADLATEHNFTPEQVAFIHGDDEEALRESAAALAAAFAPSGLTTRPRSRLTDPLTEADAPRDLGHIADAIRSRPI